MGRTSDSESRLADLRRAIPWGPLCLLVVIACLPLGVHSRYYQTIAVVIGLHSIAAVGLSLLMGYAGQVSLGHAAFYGMGAYLSGIASTSLGLNPWLAMPIAALVTGGVAAAIGTPSSASGVTSWRWQPWAGGSSSISYSTSFAR